MDAMMWWVFVGKMLTLILGIVGVVSFLIWLVDTNSKLSELDTWMYKIDSKVDCHLKEHKKEEKI